MQRQTDHNKAEWETFGEDISQRIENEPGLLDLIFFQMHHTDKYSQHSSIIWPVWLNGWVFIYELNGCGFESSCSHI